MATGGTVEEVESQIAALRAAQRAFQADLQDAEQLEVEALAAEQQARDAQQKAHDLAGEARDAIREYAGEIDQLISEWRTLVPQPRPGA